MASLSPPPLSVYYCYDPVDLAFSKALDVHLGPLKRNGWIHTWDDQQIPAGTEWEPEREAHLHTAHLLVLLVSADFLASESGAHMIQVALQRHQTGEAIVIPILVRAANWEETDLQTLQMLPREQKAITTWTDQDDIWHEITREIQRVVEAMRQWVFVAYSPEDQAFVEQLRQDMAPRGVLLWSLEKGQNTRDLSQDETRNAMRAASAVILIASPDVPTSRLVKAQLALAADYQRPILVIWARGENWRASNPGKWRVQEVIDARGERYEAARTTVLMRLRQGVTLLPSLVHPEPNTEPRNPYKGLHAFTRNDAGDFFGRESLIDELATTVETMLTFEKKGSQQIRLLPVIGPSGSGKSSAVMAGLLPCLQSGGIFDSEEWIYLDPVFPGAHPLEALAVSLAQQFPARSVLSLREDFASDSVRALHLLACQLMQASQRKIVLVVDQFEELFTLATSEEERQHFLDLLVTAVTEPRGPVLAVLTLRADFYDRLMQYPEFYQMIDAHHISVLPMESEDLRRVIERPAQLPDVQLTFEGDLVGDLLFEMRGQVGALPLLQFTLEQLFERRSDHCLTLSAYRELGGVKGALSQHAEKTYVALPSEEHCRLARALFVRLIDPGVTEQDTTRRRASLSEFALTDASQTHLLQETADAFIAARLLMTNEGAGRTTLEVSHEALIREWARLSAWLREAREDIRLQQTISEDVEAWVRHEKPADRLYRGGQLTEAQAWAQRNVPSADEMAFLQTSATERQQQEELEQNRQARELNLQRRVVSRQRILITALSFFSLIVIVLGSVAGFSFLRAEAQRQRAEQETQIAMQARQTAVIEAQIARSRELAARASNALEQSELDRALLLGVEAYQTYNTFEARDILRNALERNPQIVTVLHGEANDIGTLTFSPDGRILFSSDDYTIFRWDTRARRGQPVHLQGNPGQVGNAAFSPNNATLVTSYTDGVWQWDLQTGGRVQLAGAMPHLFNTTVAISSDGKFVAVGRCNQNDTASHTSMPPCSATSIAIWNMQSKQPVGDPFTVQDDVNGLAFSPGDTLLATSSHSGVQLWHIEALQPISTTLTNSAGATSVVFSPDGQRVAAGGIDGKVRFWHTTTYQLISSQLAGHKGAITSLAFSPDGRALATSSLDKTVGIWNLITGQATVFLSGDAQPKTCVAFSPDGKILASGSKSGTIMLWNLQAESAIYQHLDDVGGWHSALFSPNGKILLTGNDNNSVLLQDAHTGKLLDKLTMAGFSPLAPKNAQDQNLSALQSLALNSNGTVLAAGRLDGTIVLWNLKTKALLARFTFPGLLYKIVLSADGHFLVAGGDGGTIMLWDATKKRLLYSLHTDYGYSTLPIALSPDGKLLASPGCAQRNTDDKSCKQPQVLLWNVATGERTGHPLIGHRFELTDVTFSPDGHLLASSDHNDIRLWNVSTQQPIATLTLASNNDTADYYNTIAFSQDSKRLVSYSAPSEPFHFVLWDVRQQEPLFHAFDEEAFTEGSIAFSPDGQQLASVFSDTNRNVLLLWNISVSAWQHSACTIANRNLSQDEWKQFIQTGSRIKVCPDLPLDA